MNKNQGLDGLAGTAGGQPRDDRKATGKNVFDPVSLDCKVAQTLTLTLFSKETPVLLRSLAALDRYGRKDVANLVVMQQLNIFSGLKSLMDSPELLVRKFTLKLMAMLCVLPEFREEVLAVGTSMAALVGILAKENDMVLIEFPSLCLALLTSDPRPARDLMAVPEVLPVLFRHLACYDPDVQFNCLQTLLNMFNDLDGLEFYVESGLPILPVLDLTQSSYPAVQGKALEVLERLTAWNKDTRILVKFRDAKGIEALLDILETQEWRDLHAQTFRVLINVVDSPLLCEYLYVSGCLARLIAFLDSCSDIATIERLVGVLARMSQIPMGRQVLHSVSMEPRFLKYLRMNRDLLQEYCAMGIGHMAHYPLSAKPIMEDPPLLELIGLVCNEVKPWPTRYAASFGLNSLFHEVPNSIVEFLELDYGPLVALLHHNVRIPPEIMVNILQCFTVTVLYDCFRSVVVTSSLISALLSCLQEPGAAVMKNASVQLAALECFASMLVDLNACIMFTNQGGVRKVIGCLKSRYASIRQWAAQLVVLASQNTVFIEAFIHENGLQWMIDERRMRFSCPSWETAIEAIFSGYLPAKFAFTGRLSVHDITKEGFYVLQRQEKTFLILEDLFCHLASPVRPIYVANFENVKRPFVWPEEVEEEIVEEEEYDEEEHGKRSYSGEGSSERWDLGLRELYGSCASDPYLPKYLARLKERLQKTEEFVWDPKWLAEHPKLLADRARIVAQFVAEQMSGPDPDLGPECARTYLEMHLNDIKVELGTNVIPLGHIRMGSYLERAVLFKVLADRVGLPCALVRGTYGRAWVELAIPTITMQEDVHSKAAQTSFLSLETSPEEASVAEEEEEEEGKGESYREWECHPTVGIPCSNQLQTHGEWFPPLALEHFNAFPTLLLKPNVIVDLMGAPGEMYRLETYEADVYRGVYVCSKVCCDSK